MRVLERFQKGVNLGGWLSQCVSYDAEHFDSFITEDDIAKIAGWGMDHVRLPLDYDVIEEEDGTIKEDGHKHILDCIEWCRKYSLNMVIDLHKSKGFMFDKGAVPDPDKFFTDDSLQKRFLDTWTTLITRYGRYSDMIAFELLNEVVNPDYTEKWNEIADRAISLIREYAPSAYIIVGGVQHNNVLNVPKLRAPRDSHIVYNFHCYEPLCFTHQHAHWVENIDYDLSYPAPVEIYLEKSKLLNQDHAGAIFSSISGEVGPEFFDGMFSQAVKYAEEMDAPLYCGEYGIIDKAPLEDSLRWLKDITSVFNKYGIGRALWNYKAKDFGLIDEHYAPIMEDMIKVMTE